MPARPRRARGGVRRPRRKKTLREQYFPYLRRFMEHKDGREYPANHEFTQAQLLEIRPRAIVRWMNLSAYGTEEPGPDSRPLHWRSTGLGFAKKTLSWFMPNKGTPWNVESQTGNPTKSVAVNELIKAVKKSEVRKQGKKANTKRDLKRPEFRKTLQLLIRHLDFHRRFKP